MRRILSGGIKHPHFGQTVLRDAITFSRLIFCFWGTRRIVAPRRSWPRRPWERSAIPRAICPPGILPKVALTAVLRLSRWYIPSRILYATMLALYSKQSDNSRQIGEMS